jgi:hypothetical protein
MTLDIHKRLEDSQKIAVPITTLNGLWRRAPTGRERRVHVRVPTDDIAQVRIEGSSDPWAEARVLDVSRGGMRLRIHRMLAPGTLLRVQLGETEVVAEVRYCVAAEGAYSAGVQFQNVA